MDPALTQAGTVLAGIFIFIFFSLQTNDDLRIVSEASGILAPEELITWDMD